MNERKEVRVPDVCVCVCGMYEAVRRLLAVMVVMMMMMAGSKRHTNKNSSRIFCCDGSIFY